MHTRRLRRRLQGLKKRGCVAAPAGCQQASIDACRMGARSLCSLCKYATFWQQPSRHQAGMQHTQAVSSHAGWQPAACHWRESLLLALALHLATVASTPHCDCLSVCLGPLIHHSSSPPRQASLYSFIFLVSRQDLVPVSPLLPYRARSTCVNQSTHQGSSLPACVYCC